MKDYIYKWRLARPRLRGVTQLSAILVLLTASAANGQERQPADTFTTFATPVLTPRFDGPITEAEMEEFRRELGLLQAEGLDKETVEMNADRRRCPVDPAARPELVKPTVPETPIPTAGGSGTDAPGDLRLYKTHLLTDAETNDATSNGICEPSIAMNGRVTWVSGNWFSSVSDDYGDNYSYFNPSTNWPSTAGGFCCDQMIHFDRRHNLMFYYLQYSVDGTGSNIVRLAVSNGMENQANNNWYWYDFDPQAFGFANGTWFDFPGIAVGTNNIYFTTNVLSSGTSTKSICIRLDLDDLAAAASVTAFNFTSTLANLRATDGAGTTMFVGTQVDTNTLRIYKWPEGGSVSSVDRDVAAWAQGSSAPDPNGRDWIAFDFNDILAAHVIGGSMYFMWGAAASGGFAWPHIRIAQFATSNSSLLGQGQIWSTLTAWAYPDSHPSDYGGMGMMLYYGGGGWFASMCVGIADSYSGSHLGPPETALVAASTGSPSSNRWGDYVTVRRASPYDNTWIGVGHTMNATAPGSNTEVRTVWFGREVYTPAATRTIYVNDGVTNSFQDGTFPNPYDTVREGFFAAWDGDTVIIDGGTYGEAPIALDRDVQVLQTGTGDAIVD